MNFAVTKKLNMSQVFLETGEAVPVTMLKAQDLTVIQLKDLKGKDKYSAVQVGYGPKKKITKAAAGHFKNLGKFANLTEFRVENSSEYEVGKKLDISSFQIGEVVNCIGVMKGRGFAG